MDTLGPIRQLLSGATSVGSLPLTEALLKGGNAQRVGFFAELNGDALAAVSATVTVVLEFKAGEDEVHFEYPAATFEIFGTVAAGPTPVRQYFEVDIPRCLRWGLLVTAISGTNASLTVRALQGF